MSPGAVFDLKAYLNEKRLLVDAGLEACLPESNGLTSDLIRAMRYSLFAGGKRLRPILCMAGAEAVGGNGTDVLPVACALELIHTYSLIHDDLPVMDDDDLRRGKPTNHKVFGDPIALLAGDGLLTEAFSLMTSPEIMERVPPRTLVQAIRLIARAAGHQGMVGGQAVDIQWEGKSADQKVVRFMHTHKTGAMIAASVASGAILAGAGEARRRSILSYGEKIGLAFQISDDILDIEGDSETMGKQAGADEKKGKMTYPAVLGLDESRRIEEELVQGAIEELRAFDVRAEPLRSIAQYIIKRKK
ncbi:MAG: polyprenyl synthetase family protein [Deltaproteobacteria bacterium]|nr:polyprenyl synthetase family protein [Deltaproteobacteria bacterium]OQX65392.1 MAG: farnesyl-diphosphate synthase [Desulfococcus sp. 4484_242]